VQAGTDVPEVEGVPSAADQLAEISQALEAKYPTALQRWCDRTFGDCELVLGQGGDVVMLNMAYQVRSSVGHCVPARAHGARRSHAAKASFAPLFCPPPWGARSRPFVAHARATHSCPPL
jgi:hypothetical protein